MTRVLLDTDLAMGAPGSDIDDGFALALAVAEPDIEVDLVTTVGGNSDVDTSTRLTIELLQRIGRPDVEVVRGAGAPLDPRWRRPRSEAGERVDGTSPAIAAVALAERVMAEPGQLTIVAIGPLTNVALALMLEPRMADAVAEIVVMGGVYLKHTNVAGMPGEYNFWCDPDAAQAVLASGAPVRLVGLDVTEQVRLTRADADAMAAAGTAFAPFAGAAAHGWMDYQDRVKLNDDKERGSCALHDPLAVAVVARPDLVTWQDAHVQVETQSPVTRGVAVADLLLWENPPPVNARVAVGVDADAFRSYFLERMARLP